MPDPTHEIQGNDRGAIVAGIDMKLEVVVIVVSDVDRAKEFYKKLGWRLDVTPPTVVQFTPPGSWCSVQFGKTLTSAAPGSAKSYLIVSDVVAARNQLVAAGIEVGGFFHFGPEGGGDGLDPERRTCRSRASFSHPDGNVWLLQEITSRIPGRVDPGVTSFSSASGTWQARFGVLRAAHGEVREAISRHTRTGSTCTPGKWCGSRPAKSSRSERRRCDRDWRRCGAPGEPAAAFL